MQPDRSVRVRGLGVAAALVLGYLSVSGLLAWGTAGAVAPIREPGPTSVDAALASRLRPAAGWCSAGSLLSPS